MQDTQSLKAYRTIRQNSETETVIRKSRFLARCFRVSDEKEALAALESVRRGNWDARHHCYAFRIGINGALTRSSDDGEPSGTAGAPILHVLCAQDVTNALCVVTRYFGGVLLGTGGLTRAYGGAAQSALEAAGILKMTPGMQYRAEFSYPLWAGMETQLKQCAVIDDVSYAEHVTVLFWLPEERRVSTLTALIDRSEGRLLPEATAESMRAE